MMTMTMTSVGDRRRVESEFCSRYILLVFCREKKNPNPIRRRRPRLRSRAWSATANAKMGLLVVSFGVPPVSSSVSTTPRRGRRPRRRHSFVQNKIDVVSKASSNPSSSSSSSSGTPPKARRADTTTDGPLDAFLLGKALTETVLERVATETVNCIADATSLPKKIEDEMEQLKREVEKRAREERRRTTR